ncbi:Bd3614 family nucleic acid deaminase [Bdellovibrionota bacterium FG-2]
MKSRPEHIAYRLLETNPDGSLCDVAFFEFDSIIYYSIHPKEALQGPFSSIVNLIQGVYESYPENARRMLRHRLYTTATLTSMCRGMIKVAAKRASDEVVPQSHDLDASEALVKVQYDSSRQGMSVPFVPQANEFDDQAWMQLAFSLICKRPENSGPRFLLDRPVGALLVSAENRLLFIATNENASNKTSHAEVKLVQGYFRATGSPLPLGCRIYTTLKCCKMCAAMIWQSAKEPTSVRVYYGENDPGPYAQNTILSKEKVEFLVPLL